MALSNGESVSSSDSGSVPAVPLPVAPSPELVPSTGEAGAGVGLPALPSVLSPVPSCELDADMCGVDVDSVADTVSFVETVATEADQLVVKHCCGSVFVI